MLLAATCSGRNSAKSGAACCVKWSSVDFTTMVFSSISAATQAKVLFCYCLCVPFEGNFTEVINVMC